MFERLGGQYVIILIIIIIIILIIIINYPLLLAKCGNSRRKCVNDLDCVLCGLNQMRSDLCV